MKTSREDALDKKSLIANLARSPHGSLAEYLDIGKRAAFDDPNFYAHLVAWNHVKGEIRDAKVALPIIGLTTLGLSTGAYQSNVGQWPSEQMSAFAENALAHLADLSPRNLAKALLPTYQYVKDPTDKKGKRIVRVMGPNGKPVENPPFIQTAKAPQRVMRRFVARYLRDLELDRREFERTAVLHSDVLHQLYAHFRVNCPPWVSDILFGGVRKGPKWVPSPGSIFEAIRKLPIVSPEEAAGLIVRYKIPFLIARGALGKKASEPDQVLALIKAMSPTELVTNMKWLEKVGVKTVPALRSALEEALGKAVKTNKAPRATLKASKAAAVLEEAGESKLAGKLHVLQEKQLDKLGGIDGDWLVLGDKSGSMQSSIDYARQIAAILARMVKGKVHLVFFDQIPYYHDATGKTFEELSALTRTIVAGGGTDMSCGIRYMLDRKIAVDGIAFVGDGANHGYAVGPVLKLYSEKLGADPTVYFFSLDGESDVFSREPGLELQTFDLRSKHVDYHSLPNLVQTMRVGRFQLIDEVMSMPLRTLDEVLERTKDMPVLPAVTAMAHA